MKKVLLIFVAVILVGCGANYSNGERHGVVTKISEKGLFFKSLDHN